MALNVSLKSISSMQTEIVWLDIPHETTSESIVRLESIVPPCQRFENADDCQAHLFTSTAEKLLLIVHEQFARDIIPQINHLQSIVNIYVYNIDRTEELEQWFKHFPKVIIFDLDQIQWQHRIRVNEPIPINILNTDGQTSRTIDGGYLHFHRFIDVILQKETKVPERSELIQYYRQKYHEDKVNMAKINQFEETYNKENPLKW
jgi:hypothetical protein